MRKPSTEAERLTEDVLKVREARRADDGSAYARLGEHPSERDLGHADSLLLRELVNPRDQAVRKHSIIGACSTYLDVSSSKKGMPYVAVYVSVFPRTVASREVRVSSPRPSGDHGIEPTPNI